MFSPAVTAFERLEMKHYFSIVIIAAVMSYTSVVIILLVLILLFSFSVFSISGSQDAANTDLETGGGYRQRWSAALNVDFSATSKGFLQNQTQYLSSASDRCLMVFCAFKGRLFKGSRFSALLLRGAGCCTEVIKGKPVP